MREGAQARMDRARQSWREDHARVRRIRILAAIAVVAVFLGVSLGAERAASVDPGLWPEAWVLTVEIDPQGRWRLVRGPRRSLAAADRPAPGLAVDPTGSQRLLHRALLDAVPDLDGVTTERIVRIDADPASRWPWFLWVVQACQQEPVEIHRLQIGASGRRTPEAAFLLPDPGPLPPTTGPGDAALVLTLLQDEGETRVRLQAARVPTDWVVMGRAPRDGRQMEGPVVEAPLGDDALVEEILDRALRLVPPPQVRRPTVVVLSLQEVDADAIPAGRVLPLVEAIAHRVDLRLVLDPIAIPLPRPR